MTTLVDELKIYEPPKERFKHILQTIPVKQLTELFNSELVLIPSRTGYEPVIVDMKNDLIIHFIIESGNKDATISLNPYWLSYLRTGEVINISRTLDERPHEIPLPNYPLITMDDKWVACVKLKSGEKALIIDNEVIKGVNLQM